MNSGSVIFAEKVGVWKKTCNFPFEER